MTLPIGTTRWERAQRGAADRAQLYVYAVQVNERMTGVPSWSERGSTWLLCPLTGDPFDIEYGEVDKADPAIGYAPGNVVMVSKRGNQGRSTLQQHHGDMAGALRYIADVALASTRVTIARKVDAVGTVKAWGRKSHHELVINGKYGVK